MKNMTQILTLSLILLTNSVFAGTHSFEESVRSSLDNCPRLNCADAEISLQPTSVQNVQNMSLETQAKIATLISRQSDLWGDTILEGDYYSDDPVVLTELEYVVQSSEVTGYRLTYSAAGWDTSDCAFNSNNMKSLETCRKGSLVESLFLSTDLQVFFVDPTSLVHFVSDR